MNRTVFCFSLLLMAAGTHLPFRANIDHYSLGKENTGVPFLGWIEHMG